MNFAELIKDVEERYNINIESLTMSDDDGSKVFSTYRDAENFTKCSVFKEYDKNGDLIHMKQSSGYEEWNEYDHNRKCIHHKTSSGYELWRKYDEKGKLISLKDSEGFNESREYDKNGKLIRTYSEHPLGGQIEYSTNIIQAGDQ